MSQQSVDACCAESAHAAIMIERRINAVRPNCVDTKFLEISNIAGAAVRLRKRVNEIRGFAKRIVTRRNNGTYGYVQ